jgi:hypothetical protein
VKSRGVVLPSDDVPNDLDEKQLLLDCLLQDPKRSWLHYLDGRQALRVGVLLHLGKLSLPSGRGKA